MRWVPALALVGVLCGCSGGSSEAPSPLPSATVTPVPSVTPTPVLASIQGASDFVRTWFRTLDEGLREARTAELASVSSAACETCNNYIEAIADLQKHGRHAVEGPTQLIGLATTQPREGLVRTVTRYVTPEGRTVDRQGATVEGLPRDEGTAIATCRLLKGKWTMLEVDHA